MNPIAHSVVREVAGVDVTRVFDVVVAEDVLPKVLHRWGPVPGVRGTAERTGPWDTPGSARTVLLEDGSTAREQLLRWERPSTFQYRVDRMTNPLGRLVRYADGAWGFAATPTGTRFSWTYAFMPGSRVAAPLLRVFVATAWARYMADCADRCVGLARQQSG